MYMKIDDLSLEEFSSLLPFHGRT